MKWNIFVGSLVLGLGLSTQSFGFELLDRMLGIRGCGCESSCCETKGCAAKADGCEAKASCGCDAGKSSCGKSDCCRKPLLRGLFRCNRCCDKGCDDKGCAAKAGCEAKASCGCDAGKASCGADKGCGKSRCCRRGLLDRIFSCNRRCNKGCDDKGCAAKGCEAKATCGCGVAKPACGCGANGAEASDGDMAPVPPAPVVDPTAFLQGQRRIVSIR